MRGCLLVIAVVFLCLQPQALRAHDIGSFKNRPEAVVMEFVNAIWFHPEDKAAALKYVQNERLAKDIREYRDDEKNRSPDYLSPSEAHLPEIFFATGDEVDRIENRLQAAYEKQDEWVRSLSDDAGDPRRDSPEKRASDATRFLQLRHSNFVAIVFRKHHAPELKGRKWMILVLNVIDGEYKVVAMRE